MRAVAMSVTGPAGTAGVTVPTGRPGGTGPTGNSVIICPGVTPDQKSSGSKTEEQSKVQLASPVPYWLFAAVLALVSFGLIFWAVFYP